MSAAAIMAAGVAIAARVEAAPPEPGIGTLIGGRQSAAATGYIGNGAEVEKTAFQPSKEALEAGRKTAACVARTEPVRAARFVMAGPEVPIRVAYSPLQAMLETCLGNRSYIASMQFGRRTLQGLLAEGLIKQGAPMNLAPLPLDQAKYPGDLALAASAQRTVDETATCLAYTQPTKSEALVRADYAHDAERAAFQDVMPALQGCLASNVTLQANKAGIRMAVALALFRRANSPAPVQPAPTAITKR